MRIEDFDYLLPPDRIAQVPLERREDSRLMVVNRQTGVIQHRCFHDLSSILTQGDLLVLNNTRVFPARLEGLKIPGGALIEMLLLEDLGERRWKVLGRRAKRLRKGTHVEFGEKFGATVEADMGEGLFVVQFSAEGNWDELLERYGQVPLPPYISRESASEQLHREDKQRYQTVYAQHRGSAAAPTAGLHFSESLLEALSQMGVQKTFVTLHIGLDTFQPVKEEVVERHPIHAERYEISQETSDAVNNAKFDGRRVIAVGTTAVRALESVAGEDGVLEPRHGSTRLFILPGYKFRIIDAMITNFHLPRSTLLMLVSAFMGNTLRRRCYEEAIGGGYRFYSYGDAMLIV
ncbi:MAG TPA: tRNA preQ1(34) S-adenosylmethionine ribosyltransferase-isomerase QueA [bacterium]|nr:tRNA preQ1(34) S-adenosylmethionine ribosyltransferase-isomerase QueA [bacterium]